MTVINIVDHWIDEVNAKLPRARQVPAWRRLERPGRIIPPLWSGWIVVGTVLEERDLVADFGDVYRRYQQQVPMLVPWREPVSVRVVRP